MGAAATPSHYMHKFSRLGSDSEDELPAVAAAVVSPRGVANGGVVEFGDDRDELDYVMLGKKQKASKRSTAKGERHGTPAAGDGSQEAGATSRASAVSAPAHHKPKPAPIVQKEPLLKHKMGEFAHGEAHVPEDQKPVLFGDLNAANTFQELGVCDASKPSRRPKLQ
eukprot:jgi/Chrzof1/14344/UNPLg00618.t1